jgi:sn-glycerol 3-phosphate transport system permease protein
MEPPVSDLSLTAAEAPSATRSSRRPHRGDAAAALLLLGPSLVFLAGFTYWPLIQVTLRSLVQQRYGQSASFGLDNYARLFADPHFSHAALNNALYAAGTVIPSVILALGFALALRQGTRLDSLLRTLIVLPLLIPLVAAAALFTFIFLPGEGLLDFYLARLGVAATNWLGDPSLALGSIIAITVWKNTGYYMLFFLAGLAAVPEDLLDAAKIDGAGVWARFLYVTLPMLGPTFAFVLPVALLNALTQVDHVVTMTQGGPSDSTNLLLYYIYQQAEQNYDPGLACAATVVSVAALLGLSLASLQALDRRVHYAS